MRVNDYNTIFIFFFCAREQHISLLMLNPTKAGFFVSYSCCHLYKIAISCSNVKKIGRNTYQHVLHYLVPILLTP